MRSCFFGFHLELQQAQGVGVEEVVVEVAVQQGPGKDRSSGTWSESQRGPSGMWKRPMEADKVHEACAPRVSLTLPHP